MSEVPLTDVRTEAHRRIEAILENASWGNAMYHDHIRPCVDVGLVDAQAERVVGVSEVLAVIHGARILPTEIDAGRDV